MVHYSEDGIKAILVDKDRYLLPLSRYIYRNPIETKAPLVQSLDTYLWSSYHTKASTWLHRELIYEMLGHNQKYQGYRRYFEAGPDDDIKKWGSGLC